MLGKDGGARVSVGGEAVGCRNDNTLWVNFLKGFATSAPDCLSVFNEAF